MKWEDYPAFIRCSYILTTLVETHPLMVILDEPEVVHQDFDDAFYYSEFFDAIGLKSESDIYGNASNHKRLNKFNYRGCEVIYYFIAKHAMGVFDGNNVRKTLVFFKEQDRDQAMLLKLSS